MKENVQVSLDRVLRGLLITKADLDREANRYSVVLVRHLVRSVSL